MSSVFSLPLWQRGNKGDFLIKNLPSPSLLKRGNSPFDFVPLSAKNGEGKFSLENPSPPPFSKGRYFSLILFYTPLSKRGVGEIPTRKSILTSLFQREVVPWEKLPSHLVLYPSLAKRGRGDFSLKITSTFFFQKEAYIFSTTSLIFTRTSLSENLRTRNPISSKHLSLCLSFSFPA